VSISTTIVALPGLHVEISGGRRQKRCEAAGGVIRVIDAQARAALDPAVLMELQAVLADGIQAVFLGVVVSAVGAVAVAWLLPLRPAEEPAEEAAAA
jgi:hypothetical protein